MTLREYIETLNDFAKENSNALDYVVVASSDDEGNTFNKVFYGPTLGSYEDQEFKTKEFLEEEGYLPDEVSLNAVCIN